MLSLRDLPQTFLKHYKTSRRLFSISQSVGYAESSESSSSSSESSDSDNEKNCVVKDQEEMPKSSNIQGQKESSQVTDDSDSQATRKKLDELLKSFSGIKTSSQAFDVAIKPHKERFKNYSAVKVPAKKPYQEQLIGAAEKLATTLGGDSEKTKLELLSKVLRVKETDKDSKEGVKDDPPNQGSQNLSDLLTGMGFEKVEKPRPIVKNLFEQRKQNARRAIVDRGSISQRLPESGMRIRDSKQSTSLETEPEYSILFKDIFKDVIWIDEKDAKDEFKMDTWESLEQRELNLSVLRPPENVFQELILWTEQGKIWKFPINNEQGLETETKVHFSEHVFMERHIKSWCPKRGPIKHFMELVCVGLSKNPYLTVEEKMSHLLWYQEYFVEKKELLKELGCINDDEYQLLTIESKTNVQQIASQ